jgi:hypothetical protein
MRSPHFFDFGVSSQMVEDRLGSDVRATTVDWLQARGEGLQPGGPAVPGKEGYDQDPLVGLCYTSGSTGLPKVGRGRFMLHASPGLALAPTRALLPAPSLIGTHFEPSCASGRHVLREPLALGVDARAQIRGPSLPRHRVGLPTPQSHRGAHGSLSKVRIKRGEGR